MRLSKLTWCGILCLTIGPSIYMGRVAWIQTRTRVPVDMPIHLRPGHVRTPPFRTNENWPFEIMVEVRPSIPAPKWICLLGSDIPSDQCTEPPVIQAAWVLSTDGQVVAQGETSREGLLGGDEGGIPYRSIGSVDLKKGRSYVLDVDFSKDGSKLDSIDPHLKVEAQSGTFYEDASLGLLLFYAEPCTGLTLLGVGIVIFSGVRYWRSKRL